MSIDLYTKAVLSVIAGSLVWLCVNAITPVALAQADAQKVVIAGWDRPLQVIIVDEKGTPLVTAQGFRLNGGSQPLAVSLGNQTVPVAIRRIERSGAWQPIPVDVVKTPPSQYPGP